MTKNREVRLKEYPEAVPSASHFEVVDVPVPEPGDGEMLIRNIYLSVDPYMRGRMADRKSYVAPFSIGGALEGGAVGQVVQSQDGKFAAGEYVTGMMNWREFNVSDGKGLTRITPNIAPIQTFLGTLGMPGLTAYIGLLDIGQPKKGETVFVSAASGAVGSVVCQIAKIKGCRVVGSAGSDAKVAWLKEEAGVDEAFNYKQVDDLVTGLGQYCPKGIDVNFENVGGDHFKAALTHMNDFGRVVLCGMISQYNSAKPPAVPGNLMHVIAKRLTLQGFIVTDHTRQFSKFFTDMGQWIAGGKITWKETIADGIENAPQALIGLFDGANFGKMLVQVAPEQP